MAQLPRLIGLITHTGLLTVASHCQDIELLPSTPEAYATDLYAALHRLDDKQVKSIVVLRPPQDNDWRAVIDRLDRAAALVATAETASASCRSAPVDLDRRRQFRSLR